MQNWSCEFSRFNDPNKFVAYGKKHLNWQQIHARVSCRLHDLRHRWSQSETFGGSDGTRTRDLLRDRQAF
jgi:hypothetical protein